MKDNVTLVLRLIIIKGKYSNLTEEENTSALPV